MSDDELEQLASAVLDGVATAGERARLDADPRGRAHLAALREVRTLLATSPAPVEPVLREAHLAAALAAWSGPDTNTAEADPAPGGHVATRMEPAESSAGRAPVVDLADARHRRRRWAPVLAAAAAVALLAGVGLTLRRGGDDSAVSTGAASAPEARTPKMDNVPASTPPPAIAADQDAAGAADEARDAADPVASGPSPAASDGATPPVEDMVATAEAAPFDTPVEVNSRQELTAAVSDALAAEAALPEPQTAAPRSSSRCPAPGGELIMQAVWLGREAYVYVQPSIADPQQVLVLDALSCGQLFNAPLVP